MQEVPFRASEMGQKKELCTGRDSISGSNQVDSKALVLLLELCDSEVMLPPVSVFSFAKSI